MKGLTHSFCLFLWLVGHLAVRRAHVHIHQRPALVGIHDGPAVFASPAVLLVLKLSAIDSLI
jgi:hypothetical protein